MVKVYEMARFDAITIRINYLGQTILANFKGGDQRRNKARLVTSDIFIQDAIEHDSRFGKLFYLVKKYDNTPSGAAKLAADKGKVRKVTKVKTVNEALLYFTSLGASVTGECDLNSLMEQYNVEFPNLRR